MIRIIDGCPVQYHGIFLFIARINNYIHYKVRDWLSILSQFQQFSGWILGIYPQFYWICHYLSMLRLINSGYIKGARGSSSTAASHIQATFHLTESPGNKYMEIKVFWALAYKGLDTVWNASPVSFANLSLYQSNNPECYGRNRP